MPKAQFSPLLQSLSGRIGDLVFAKQANGEVFVRRRPVRKAPRTPAETAQNQRLGEAVRYAQSVQNDPVRRAFYASLPRGPHTGAYQLALRDYLRQPKVESIDVSAYKGKSGQSIGITASDDTGVVELTVQITGPAGKIEEEGSAAKLDEPGRHWRYLATVEIPQGQVVTVTAIAKDRPGHTDSSSTLAQSL